MKIKIFILQFGNYNSKTVHVVSKQYEQRCVAIRLLYSCTLSLLYYWCCVNFSFLEILTIITLRLKVHVLPKNYFKMLFWQLMKSCVLFTTCISARIVSDVQTRAERGTSSYI